MSTQTLDKKSGRALALIVGVAVVLRCLYLSRQSLWIDESASWNCSMQDFWGALHCDINKPPLYYPLLHYWMNLFGTSEAALRSLSVLPSVATVWVIYVLGTRLFSRPVGYLAAAYAAVSTFQIYFAQEARNYSWLVLFLLLAGLFLWNALEADSRRRQHLYWAAYTASITLALYTHYFALFFIAGHGCYVLLRHRRQLLAATLSIATALVLIAPFLLIFLGTAGSTQDEVRRYPFLKLGQAYFTFLFGESLIPQDEQAVRHIVQTLRADAWMAVLAAASLAIFIRFGWLAWKKWREPVLYTAFHAVVPVLLAFGISMKKSFFDRRYMSPAAPYIYLLVAVALWEILLRRKNHADSPWKISAGMAALAAFCLLLAVSLYQYYFAARFGKEQWRDAIAYIEASASPSGRDLVVLDPDYLQFCYRYYEKRDLPFWAVTSSGEREALSSGSLLRERLQGYRKVRLVYSHNLNEDLLVKLKHLYPEVDTREFPLANQIKVYTFQVTPAQ